MASQDPCRTTWRLQALGALADGELPAPEAAVVEEHARGCASCGPRLASLREQGALLRAQAEARVDALDLGGFSKRVMQAVAQDTVRPSFTERAKVVSLEQWRTGRPLLALVGFSAAACLLLAVALRPGPAPVAAPDLLLAQASVDFLELDGQSGTVLESPGRTTVIWVQENAAPEGEELR